MIKLLLVDDERGITDLLSEFFSSRGFSTRSANNGDDALDAIKSERPDIVFLDINMDGMGGLETLEMIKSIDPKIKVVMLTMHDAKEIVERAMELGADEYVVKPLKVGYLEKVVIKKVEELAKEKSKK
jgi:DNA-binding NtrC family response regulator